MRKSITIIIVVLVVILVIFVFTRKAGNEITQLSPSPIASPTPTVLIATTSIMPTVTATMSPAASPKLYTMNITANGFSPSELTINRGDTVKFVNMDSIPHRPASGPHPTHQLCQGFDSIRGLNKDEFYSFTFNEAKECLMHDHLNPSSRGKIIVK